MQEEGTPLPGASLQASFAPIKPGGQREPLIYDPKGYFVMTLDHSAGQIILRHSLPDHTPVHEMRVRTAESMLLGLIREGLISQLSHAGYLGGELAKAEAALRLGVRVRYEQDCPLRSDTPPPEEAAAPAAPKQIRGARSTAHSMCCASAGAAQRKSPWAVRGISSRGRCCAHEEPSGCATK